MRCTAFRRLDFKTQVFVPHEHDHFRTRLTHTLEVARTGRDIARDVGLNEDLVEAACLAHDLGHPPFGHAGEAVLDRLMADHGRFEHNCQSLRIVDYLEHPFPGFRGLNLTNAVRECIARHRTSFDAPDIPGFDPSRLPPLEGQVCDAADEIAYTAADLEDGLVSGWITPADLETLGLWDRALSMAREDFPGAREIHTRIGAVRNVLQILVTDLVEATLANISQLSLRSPDDARGAGRRCAAFSDAVGADFLELKEFLNENLYMHPENQAQARRSAGIITGLFEAFVANPSLLPERYSSRIDREGENGRVEGAHRVVCDYIAGMTDRFCRKELARVTG
jgi:dGTPase